MSHGAASNVLRIVGGQWRSRRLRFEDAEGLRPTPDRVRETLFNWLQGEMVGAICLDAFSGSGALGFEALSRGAKKVYMVEMARKPFMRLKENATLLNADGACLVQGSVLDWLSSVAFLEKLDGVFLDPPFHKNILPGVCQALINRQCLKPDAFIYVESEQDWAALDMPSAFVMHKETKAGLVKAYLARYEPENA